MPAAELYRTWNRYSSTRQSYERLITGLMNGGRSCPLLIKSNLRVGPGRRARRRSLTSPRRRPDGESRCPRVGAGVSRCFGQIKTSAVCPFSEAKRTSTGDAGQLRFYEYTPFCNGPGDVKSPRVIVTPPSSRFCPWSALRPPHYAVRRNGEPI